MKISIDQRMKDFYEKRNRNFLLRRVPVIIRIDGKAFHTYTRNLTKPFDDGLIQDMQYTALYLCRQIQGCKFAYTQSDEISLLLTDYDTFETDAWFDYCQGKLDSVSASLTTMMFNLKRVERYNSISISNAIFDARSFNIPKEDVCNYFIWRQQDATKNSISMLAQSIFSHKQLQGKNSKEMIELCIGANIDWFKLSAAKRMGTAIYKATIKKDLTNKTPFDKLKDNPNMWREDESYGLYLNDWVIDLETPNFLETRSLITNLV